MFGSPIGSTIGPSSKGPETCRISDVDGGGRPQNRSSGRCESHCFASVPRAHSESLFTGLRTMLNSDEPLNEIDFDGGTTGCGELLLDLLLYMKRQAPGAKVTVRALDPGAPLEIPAWCRMTQHELIEAKHPIYLLRKP